ncbi:hypothetical protein OAA91_00150 [Fibrobacterales bacterium]|nr:hypothetical protein [Fibrobacterales bacterium]
MLSVEIKLYVIMVLASLISCFVGFNLETIKAKIHLVKTKKKARVKIVFFPTIPIVPFSYLLVAFGFNWMMVNLGFMIVGLYFGLETTMKVLRLLKFKKQYNLMKPKVKKGI